MLDVRLPDGNGIEVCREVRSRSPDTACLILTAFRDDGALFDAIMAGAAGYLLKDVNGRALVDAVRRVGAGESLLDPTLTGKVLDRLRNGDEQHPRLKHLSEKELRVLELIAEGLTNRQIAEQLHLAEKTVKNYVSNVLGKLALHRRTEAAVLYSSLEYERHQWT